MQNKLKPIDILVVLLDVLITVAAFTGAYLLRGIYNPTAKPLFEIGEYSWILWIFIPTQYLSFAYFGLYGSKKTNPPLIIAANLVKAFGITALISAAAVFVIKSDVFSRLMFVIFLCIGFVTLLVERLVLRIYLVRAIKNNTSQKRVLIVGDADESKILENLRANDDLLVNVIGFVGINRETELGNVSDIYRIIVDNTADEVYFVINEQIGESVEAAIGICESLGITIKVILDLFNLKFSKTQLSYAGKMPMLTFHTVSLNEGQLLIKRIMDIICSVIGLAITGVLTLFIVPAIKLDSKGPVFFSQTRVGKNGRKFKIYKFRTMQEDAENHLHELLDQNEMSGAVFKMENDPRITKVGSFLRKTSLDELPQFFNILKGEMSLVGTRPPTVGEVEEYQMYHRRRLSIKPGLTGNWQISGRNKITDFEDIYALDIDYIDNWSIALDIKIILKTFSAVLSRRGAE